jgi:hypothetical protein
MIHGGRRYATRRSIDTEAPMGERREVYRGKDRRDGSRSRYRCRCERCTWSKLRQQALADLETGESLDLWYRGEPMSREEERIRRSLPPAYRRLPTFALADYLEENGRFEDAEYLRKL